MKIGILAHDLMTWSGGVDFLTLVVDSLNAAAPNGDVEFHVLVPDRGPRLAWRRFRKRVHGALKGGSPPKPEAPFDPADLIAYCGEDRIKMQHIDIGRRAIARAMDCLDLQIVLPAVHSLGRNFPHPWLAYAYDFQHKYFPQYFTAESCRSRDEHFGDILTAARAVIVNSRAAADDIARFVPQATARVFAMPLAPAPALSWLADHPDVLPRYELRPPFFLISNQFWAHKGHDTAFEAFRLVAQQNREVTLVCTGSTSGAQDPQHIAKLREQLRTNGVEERVRLLGLIPRPDQVEIMKRSCAVLQPSLFEGGPGGGSVAGALALGVPSICSDIPVNLELQGEPVTFFKAGDANDLAEKMRAALLAKPVRQSPKELLALGRTRRAACGKVLWNAVSFVTQR